MARNKTKEKKEFLVSQRDKVGPGYLNTPVWIIQKAGKRIWNRKQKRNWRQTEFGAEFKKLELEKKDSVLKTKRTSGKRTKSAKYAPAKRTRNTTIVRNTKAVKKKK